MGTCEVRFVNRGAKLLVSGCILPGELIWVSRWIYGLSKAQWQQKVLVKVCGTNLWAWMWTQKQTLLVFTLPPRFFVCITVLCWIVFSTRVDWIWDTSRVRCADNWRVASTGNWSFYVYKHPTEWETPESVTMHIIMLCYHISKPRT